MNGYKERILQAGIQMVHVHPKELSLDPKVAVVIGGKVTSNNIELLPGLKLVIVPFTGLDGLDLPALLKAGVQVVNTSAHAVFVAERAVALLLALMGQIVRGHMNLVRKDWSKRFSADGIPWKSIRNKKVAIYGYGVIGKEIGSLLSPWQVELGVLTYKDRVFASVRAFGSLSELCDWCDVLMVAAPLTEMTEGSIDDHILQRLKGKVLVNVGRGTIVDEKALFSRLADGTLAGFASDVWYHYPNRTQSECWPSEYPIHELPNVVMTPHNAAFEETSEKLRYEDVLDKVIEFAMKTKGGSVEG